MNDESLIEIVKQNLVKCRTKFDSLKTKGTELEAEIAELQNAHRKILEEMVRLQGERRALDSLILINNQEEPCQPTPLNPETDSEK